ncbi:MBL fold metallo-hydrolase [Knoellia sp. 3-2P3]|uniref:MBL fold metallo-hydrolase n=1 Tax=unclassified Knoellia TaxID=2618719 RepID=UPI0023DA9094|nr:MBL fold metallo-hydrolase [Knoellia sp. 3-2P3]MDF2093483.1 MBL fold metallo-hydrolase [Knoellia sp. 3-2P3]
MSLRVTWLGHSTVVLDIDGARLVSDPLLERHAGILRRRFETPRAHAWEGADAVLLSHLHHDHAHLASLRQLSGTPVLTAPACAGWLEGKGIDGGTGLEGGEWATVGVRSQARVRLVRAVHAHRPMPHRPNDAHGHLVQSATATVWVAGDTELYPDMGELAALAGAPIDLAVVPVSGWAPRLSGGHMNHEEAARACDLVGARYAIPVHWGTLHVPAGKHLPRGWMDRPGLAFARDVRRLAPDCEPVVLHPGESWALGD